MSEKVEGCFDQAPINELQQQAFIDAITAFRCLMEPVENSIMSGSGGENYHPFTESCRTESVTIVNQLEQLELTIASNDVATRERASGTKTYLVVASSFLSEVPDSDYWASTEEFYEIMTDNGSFDNGCMSFERAVRIRKGGEPTIIGTKKAKRMARQLAHAHQIPLGINEFTPKNFDDVMEHFDRTRALLRDKFNES